MSQPSDTKKMKINRACDLNSISVLPPYTRRPISMSQPSQIRSQSQQSFSQGMSFSQSQLSQNSLEENLMSDQRFDSQERDKPAKRISSLASGTSTRDESQLQLSRTSNNVIRRWNSASVPDNRCHVSEELENRFRHMESSLNRLGMILDSVQSDVMQVNRAVKEVALETEGVRQKIILLDNSMQHVIKEEEALRAFLDSNLKSLPEQIKESERKKLNEIVSSISDLPKQIEAHLVKFQHEVCMIITSKREEIAHGIKSFDNRYPDPVQSPKINCYAAARLSQKNQLPISMLPPSNQTRRFPTPKMKAEIPKTLQPKLTGSKIAAEIQKTLQPKFSGTNRNSTLKQEEKPFTSEEKYTRVTIDSDEESDGGLSCLFLRKETGKASYLIEEAKEETARILRKARKKKRKQSNCIILD